MQPVFIIIRQVLRPAVYPSVQFLLRFTAFDGCERVDKLRMIKKALKYQSIRQYSLVHIYHRKKMAAKISSVNGFLSILCRLSCMFF